MLQLHFARMTALLSLLAPRKCSQFLLSLCLLNYRCCSLHIPLFCFLLDVPWIIFMRLLWILSLPCWSYLRMKSQSSQQLLEDWEEICIEHSGSFLSDWHMFVQVQEKQDCQPIKCHRKNIWEATPLIPHCSSHVRWRHSNLLFYLIVPYL